MITKPVKLLCAGALLAVTVSGCGDYINGIHDEVKAYGLRVVFESNRVNSSYYILYVMKADGTAITQLSDTATRNEQYATWSPDGTKIAFCSTRDGGSDPEIYIMNADGTDQVRITDDTASQQNLSWHPDGSKIAYSLAGGGSIRSINIDGTNDSLISSTGYIPVWSHDGTRIAHLRSWGGGLCLYIMNADATGAVRLVGDFDSSSHSWSPDDSRIVFHTSAGIHIMKTDGTETMNSTSQYQLRAGGKYPAWSPDGSRILFFYNSAVYTINPDGTGEEKLFDTPAGKTDKSFRWSPI